MSGKRKANQKRRFDKCQNSRVTDKNTKPKRTLTKANIQFCVTFSHPENVVGNVMAIIRQQTDLARAVVKIGKRAAMYPLQIMIVYHAPFEMIPEVHMLYEPPLAKVFFYNGHEYTVLEYIWQNYGNRSLNLLEYVCESLQNSTYHLERKTCIYTLLESKRNLVEEFWPTLEMFKILLKYDTVVNFTGRNCNPNGLLR